MKPMKRLGLCTITLIAGGCSNGSYSPSSYNFYEPGTPFGNRYGSSLPLDTACPKRGCDNNKLFFNPAHQETTLERYNHEF
ncbi:Uncharacterised protein [Pseudomonas fluorescens]|uniref:Lipoprotein n=1 Tax=Pseudomonas fluorescens TaxID=294 RepID=A0A379IFV6_PSEFL|nr:hypothetical protein [Pseudomonas fluorescens]SUD31654.1 Uncharacterised protein [Pseudomonas fluorescens]